MGVEGVLMKQWRGLRAMRLSRRRRILLGGGSGREVPLILFRPSIWNKHEKGERGGQRGLATSLANTVAFTANSLCITATGISETC